MNRAYALPVEETRWQVPGGAAVTLSWDYDDGRDRLLSLYERGKHKQWNANSRLDWSLPVDPTSPEVEPDYYIPIFGSAVWERLTSAERDTLRHHVAAWVNSQFLHGEQGALVCAAKVVATVPDVDSKFYASTQVIDEARHVEVYSRYVRDKLQLAYPIEPSLKALLNDVIVDPRWDMTYLGMQVVIEGLALAAFSMLRDLTEEPLAKSINAYVMQDEARHVAFGRLALRDFYPELSPAERNEREEFVIEACHLMQDRFRAREVWECLGLPVADCLDYVDHSPMMREFRKMLFGRIVPTVRDIGLWGPKIQQAFADLGVIQFAEVDPDAMERNDEQVAQALDAARAGSDGAGSDGAGSDGAGSDGAGSDGAATAATVAAAGGADAARAAQVAETIRAGATETSWEATETSPE
jgi:hypothetical protein